MTRRLAMAAAAIVLTLSLAAWGASMLLVIWRSPAPPDLSLVLWRGEVSVSNMGLYAGPGWTVYGFDGWSQRWWPHPDHGFIFQQRYSGGPRRWKLNVPLWMPSFAALLALFGLWRHGARARARLGDGRCRACGYQLDGLPAGAECPECGRAAQAASP